MLSAPYSNTPIQISHVASLIQAFHESGGMMSAWRFHGLISGNRFGRYGGGIAIFFAS
jgi:hypothetical protein